MTEEIIKKIKGVEKETEVLLEKTVQECQKLLAQAEGKQEEIIKSREQQAKKEALQLRKEAEAAANKQIEQQLAKTKEEKERLIQQAKKHFSQAITLVSRRITEVNGHF